MSVDRKLLKNRAKQTLKKHYWFFTILCLIFEYIGMKETGGVGISAAPSYSTDYDDTTNGLVLNQPKMSDVINKALEGKEKESQRLADEITDQEVKNTKEGKGNLMLGRSRGVLAKLANGVTSGSMIATMITAVHSIVGSSEITMVLFITISMLLSMLVWIFFSNMYQVILCRVYLEGRIYESVPVQRLTFLLRVKRWTRVSLTMLLKGLYSMFWSFTVIGGVIKYYSYFMVPYIAAENPSIRPKQAVRLSRRMMKGHKWECFILQLSFFGWRLLGAVTGSLSNVFFFNAYKESCYAEYYAVRRFEYVRQQKEEWELLNDRYLFEKADELTLTEAYMDAILTLEDTLKEETVQKGIRAFLVDIFGVILSYSQREKEYEKEERERIRFYALKDAAAGRAYPGRLFVIPEQMRRKHMETLYYFRHYSVWSLVLMFFIFSFIGWMWEVSLHLIADGVFVNRGVMYGPWLPIYGSGGVLILVLLNRFRKRPLLEFFMIILLCGTVEYLTSYVLEVMHNGEKWWDYSGYFLNLNGRICAEGLLVFGIGGMAIVYLLAPILDNHIRQIPTKTVVTLSVVLLTIFTADQVYAMKYPNQGKGITDYKGARLEQMYQIDRRIKS